MGFKKLTKEVRSLLPLLKEGLRTLGLSSYEVTAYASLISLHGPAKVEDILKESENYGKIPPSRIYAILNSLERKGFLKKSTEYPRIYEAVIDKRVLESLVESKVKWYRDRLYSSADEVWSKCFQYLRKESGGSWKIGGEKEAVDITRDMWREADKEILLMTESGRWVIENPELTEILKEKGRLKNFQIHTLVSVPKKLDEGRRKYLLKFEKLLTDMNATIYHYNPGIFRMDIVDEDEGLLFLYLTSSEDSEGIILYTREDKAIKELRRLFYLEVLSSEEVQPKIRLWKNNLDVTLSTMVEKLFSL